jgi:hypothetical protein
MTYHSPSITVAAALAAVALAGPLVLTSGPAAAASGAAPSMSQTASHAPQPRTRAGAQAAAAEAFDDYAAGDYGLFWDRWSATSKKVVSRANYVKRFRLCTPVSEGLPFVIKKVAVSGNRARVRATRLGIFFSYDFVYERGAWRYVLPAEVAREYRTKTVTQIVREERAAGACE